MQTQQTDSNYTYNVHINGSNNTTVNLPFTPPTGRRHGHLQPLHRKQRQHRCELWKRCTTLAVSN